MGNFYKTGKTGRQIAIFSDVHGLLEPLEAVIQDIQRRGITEIYSLGDNIGCGPSPCEVIDLLRFYNIHSVAGNSEDYCTLGIEPYINSFNEAKLRSQQWTSSVIDKERFLYMKELPRSIDIEVGGKRLALCHFANDVRTDYDLYGTEFYLRNFNSGEAYKQFLYTNSLEHKRTIEYNINKFGLDSPYVKGYVSARDYPIFDGKMVNCYNSIIQGHVHRNLYEKSDNAEFYTIRAVALHFDDNSIDMAFYIILHERTNGMGFDIEKVYIPFDRERMEDTILKSDEPTGRIKKMVKMI